MGYEIDVKCWECKTKLVYIEGVGYIHPKSKIKCEVEDGIEIAEIDRKIRDMFNKKVKETVEGTLEPTLRAILIRYYKKFINLKVKPFLRRNLQSP